jgi:hypothetical protein
LKHDAPPVAGMPGARRYGKFDVNGQLI